MSKFIGHRENSRTGWGKNVNGEWNPDLNDIKLGCLLRIADATEAMAKNHVQLQRGLDFYKAAYERANNTNAWLARSNAAMRGYIKRLKRGAK